MREMRTVRDYYTDVKRTHAITGPYRGVPRGDYWAGVILAITIGVVGAFILFMELSK
jgi:hypothetical protein